MTHKKPTRLKITLALTLLIVLILSPGSTQAQEERSSPGSDGTEKSLEPIEYTLRFPHPERHSLDVEAILPSKGRESITIFMAVWTPGSYMVREYARQIETLVATPLNEEEELPLTKVRKNRWTVSTQGHEKVRLVYRLYCREKSVRTNWVDRDRAILNGAPTFLSLVPEEGDGRSRPFRVKVVLPSHWSRVISPLDALPSPPETPSFSAPDYDTLVDSPLLAGNPDLYPFEVDGKPHLLVQEGGGDLWDGPQAARDAEKIVISCRDLFGDLPYPRYVFFNGIIEGRGGLEHLNSTLMMTSRWNSRIRDKYLDWLGLVSHEFFHVWNVKRLRPVELGPFDYEKEVYTRDLWIAEGITSYYTFLQVFRAGLCTEKELLKKLSGLIEKLENSPGKNVQTLAESSYDAWIKFYRPDENSPNTTVSYYTKGAIVAMLLDLELLRITDGRRSLDDVLRLAYGRYSETGYTSSQFETLVEEIAGKSLTQWFDKHLRSTENLIYDESLEWHGLRFKPVAPPKEGEDPSESEDDEGDEKKPPKAWLGLDAEKGRSQLVVKWVKRGTPAATAGLNVGDEILALNGFRVLAADWKDRLRQYRPGETARLLVSRSQRLFTLETSFGTHPGKPWKIEPAPDASQDQLERRRRWLSGE